MFTQMRAAQIYTGSNYRVAWEYKEILQQAGNGKWVLIPDEVNNLSIHVALSGGAGCKIETTTDTVDIIKNGSPNIQAWPFGVITENRTEACEPVTAIRAVQVGSGQTIVALRVQ